MTTNPAGFVYPLGKASTDFPRWLESHLGFDSGPNGGEERIPVETTREGGVLSVPSWTAEPLVKVVRGCVEELENQRLFYVVGGKEKLRAAQIVLVQKLRPSKGLILAVLNSGQGGMPMFEPVCVTHGAEKSLLCFLQELQATLSEANNQWAPEGIVFDFCSNEFQQIESHFGDNTAIRLHFSYVIRMTLKGVCDPWRERCPTSAWLSRWIDDLWHWADDVRRPKKRDAVRRDARKMLEELGYLQNTEDIESLAGKYEGMVRTRFRWTWHPQDKPVVPNLKEALSGAFTLDAMVAPQLWFSRECASHDMSCLTFAQFWAGIVERNLNHFPPGAAIRECFEEWSNGLSLVREGRVRVGEQGLVEFAKRRSREWLGQYCECDSAATCLHAVAARLISLVACGFIQGPQKDDTATGGEFNLYEARARMGMPVLLRFMLKSHSPRPSEQEVQLAARNLNPNSETIARHGQDLGYDRVPIEPEAPSTRSKVKAPNARSTVPKTAGRAVPTPEVHSAVPEETGSLDLEELRRKMVHHETLNIACDFVQEYPRRSRAGSPNKHRTCFGNSAFIALSHCEGLMFELSRRVRRQESLSVPTVAFLTLLNPAVRGRDREDMMLHALGALCPKFNSAWVPGTDGPADDVVCLWSQELLGLSKPSLKITKSKQCLHCCERTLVEEHLPMIRCAPAELAKRLRYPCNQRVSLDVLLGAWAAPSDDVSMVFKCHSCGGLGEWLIGHYDLQPGPMLVIDTGHQPGPLFPEIVCTDKVTFDESHIFRLSALIFFSPVVSHFRTRARVGDDWFTFDDVSVERMVKEEPWMESGTSFYLVVVMYSAVGHRGQ